MKKNQVRLGLGLLAMLAIGVSVWGYAYTWTGNTSDEWCDNDNWTRAACGSPCNECPDDTSDDAVFTVDQVVRVGNVDVDDVTFAADVELEVVNGYECCPCLGFTVRDGTLKLLTHPKSGSGVWEAAGPAGHLQVDVEVTGSGAWVLEDDFDARIEINAASPCLTGPVSLWQGTLDINQNFMTTGNVTLGGAGLIDVAAGKTARFSGAGGSCAQ